MCIYYMTNTRKNRKGGKTIASGGYGCVFNPVLKCKGSTNREPNKISKLMTERHATEEYEQINKVKGMLNNIPNYEDYFLLYDATICKPDKLTSKDLDAFNDKCSALPKDGITKKNINSKLDEIMALNIPNGGLPVDDYIYKSGSYEKIYNVNNALINLLKNGILKMNKNHVYHNDVKDSNILIDDSNPNSLKARLIDWGLTVEYNGNDEFPRNWKNRPLQFNIPFSVIIFTDTFYKKYTNYLKEGGSIEENTLRPFVLDYLNTWIKERGPGHYKFINEIMFLLHNHTLTSVSDKQKPIIIETEITIPSIVNYIVDVLMYYTKFKSDKSLDLSEYLDNVYVHIVDVWGFITAYYPFLETFSNNFSQLSETELKIFNQIKMIFNKYLYSPRHKPYDIQELISSLEELGNLIHNVDYGDKKKGGNKYKKTKRYKKTKYSQLFNRKKLIHKFRKPFLLSLK